MLPGWNEFPLLPPNFTLISTLSACSIGYAPSSNITASGTYPAANRAIFVPFRVTQQITAAILWVLNGATANGNLDMGIYTAAGTRLVSKGSTAQAGTSVVQTFDITDTTFGPGLFYLAIAGNATTITTARQTHSVSFQRILGCAQMAAAFPLPATATFATVASAVVPVMGLSTGTSL